MSTRDRPSVSTDVNQRGAMNAGRFFPRARVAIVVLFVPLFVLLAIAWLPIPSFRPGAASTERLPNGALEMIPIASPEDALTFARFEAGEETRLLLVTSYRGGAVTGVDVSDIAGVSTSDPIRLFHSVGYDGLVLAAGSDATVDIPVAALTIPIVTHREHVAIGINYADHADEAAQAAQPYLFPKQLAVGHFLDDVSRGDALLDYEAELGFVLLDDLPADAPDPTRLGLILGNDFTDRAAQLREADLGNMASGQGFLAAKSRPGYLPLGNLFVIPRDLDAFVRGLRLDLYVNGWLRQRAEPRDLIWGPERMVAEARSSADRRWSDRGVSVPLSSVPGVLRRGTIILSGTSAGAIFRPPGLVHRAQGFADYVLGLRWFETSVVDRTVERWLADGAVAAEFLQPGDEVIIRAELLGIINTTVVP